jgi:hypothetical protein
MSKANRRTAGNTPRKGPGIVPAGKVAAEGLPRRPEGEGAADGTLGAREGRQVFSAFSPYARRETLAIDPGPTRSAFVRWDGQRVVDSAWCDNEEIRDVIAMNRRKGPIAIEMIASYGMAVGADVFQTCVEIGRFVEAAQGNVSLVFRRDVKMHLCGSARAKDANIRQALLDRLGPVGTKKAPGPLYGVKSHIWAALAVAITHEAGATA